MKLTARKLEAMGARRKGAAVPVPKLKRVHRQLKFVERSTLIVHENGSVSAEITLPHRLVPGDNQREHWTRRRKRAAEHGASAEAAVLAAAELLPWWSRRELGVVVTIIRLGPRKLDSHDGLAPSAKHIVDGVTQALAIGKPRAHVKLVKGQRVTTMRYDDSDPRISWSYDQKYPSPYGVRIVMEARQ